MPSATAKAMGGMSAGSVISVRTLAGWKGGKSGIICLESALFSVKQRELANVQGRGCISSPAAAAGHLARFGARGAAIGPLKTSFIGFWICNSVKIK